MIKITPSLYSQIVYFLKHGSGYGFVEYEVKNDRIAFKGKLKIPPQIITKKMIIALPKNHAAVVTDRKALVIGDKRIIKIYKDKTDIKALITVKEYGTVFEKEVDLLPENSDLEDRLLDNILSVADIDEDLEERMDSDEILRLRRKLKVNPKHFYISMEEFE